MARTVLVVDDSASIRMLVGLALKGAGYDVIEGADGAEGMARLTGQRVHLVITDLNMPNVDGIEFVRRLKLHPSYKFTPIVMLTTESGEDRKREGQAAGVKAWMVKPFRPEQMIDLVARLALP